MLACLLQCLRYHLKYERKDLKTDKKSLTTFGIKAMKRRTVVKSLAVRILIILTKVDP